MVKVSAPRERQNLGPHQQFEGFLRGQLIDGGWNHRCLIKMAAVACLQHPGREVQLIRQGLMALNASFMKPGHEGYHQTLTCFWTDMVKHWIARVDPSSRTFWDELEEVFYDSKIPLQFYSQQLLDSPEAKLQYLSPDLANVGTPVQLDFGQRQLWRRFCFQEILADEWDLSLQMRISVTAARLYAAQSGYVLNAGIQRLRSKRNDDAGHFDSAFCVHCAKLVTLKLAEQSALTDQQIIDELVGQLL